MTNQIRVTHKKVDAGKYEIYVNEERVGKVFKEWPKSKGYHWSHSKVADRDIVEGKGAWRTRRKATINLLIEHFFGEDVKHKQMLEALWNG